MTTSNAINIKRITSPDKFSVVVDFSVPSALDRYFKENRFTASYNISLEHIPQSILVIPFLSNILPVAWANGIDIYVDEVDSEFYDAIFDIKHAFKQMYPDLNMNGNVIFKKIIKNEGVNAGRTSQLFSGGLDSLATFIRKASERPFLITIWGADVKLNDIHSWERVKNYNSKIANDLNTDISFVKSNFKEFVDYRELDSDFGRIVVGWWIGVQHGFGMAGLCAPITFKKGLSAFYIASSHTADYKRPYGSHPTIDNKIRWANTKVVHEAYELTRQQKVKVISQFIRDEYNTLQIRVCWRDGSNGTNCNKCEKCARTVVGLLLEGIDPNKHGFEITESFLLYVKNQFETKEWKLDEAVVFQWKDIQRYIPQNEMNDRYIEFYKWLGTFEFKKYEPNFLIKSRIAIGNILPKKPKNYVKKILGMQQGM